ncbi:MAG: type II toxin-antitoxin system VapC family toxin [Gemmatimonadota bacterium]|jgi:ribonuclease VapC
MRNNARYVLDSFALLAYLEDERGAEEVEEILSAADEGRARVWMCAINLGEVLYVTEREESLEAAQRVVAIVDQLPIEVVDPERALTFTAAHVKAHHSISYADAFAVALDGRSGVRAG